MILSPEFARFAGAAMDAGRYGERVEVVAAGASLLQRQEAERACSQAERALPQPPSHVD